MTTTSTKVILDLSDGLDAKAGATPTISDVLTQCDISDLADGIGEAHKWATFEPNEWLLDGSYHLLEESASGAQIGIMSSTISGADGSFGTPPELTITFDGDYDLEYGITLYFNSETGDYCDDVDIEFFDSGDVSLDSDSYTPNATKYFCALPSTPIEGVRYIVITFNSTAAAYRHLRLVDIDIDTISFKGNEVQKAVLTEETCPISTELPSNQFDFDLFSEDSSFSVLAPTGIYQYIERYKTKVDVYEIVDAVYNYKGRFYLDKLDSVNTVVVHFKCIDGVGLLGTIPYSDAGKYYYTPTGIPGSHSTIDEFLTDLFTGTGLTYTCDTVLQDVEIAGVLTLDVRTKRDALQQLAFGYGAYVDCSNSASVNFKKMSLVYDLADYDYDLDNTSVAKRKIEKAPLVTGIKLTAHSYYDNDDHNNYQIYNGSIQVGTYRFLMPVDYLAFSTSSSGSATVSTDPQLCFFDVTVTVAGDLYWSVGESKAHTREVHEITLPGLPSGAIENIVNIEDAYFVTPYNVAEVLARLIFYYSQQYVFNGTLLAEGVECGESIDDDSGETKNLSAIIERVENDLTGGYLQRVKARGIATPYTTVYYPLEYLIVAGGGSGGVKLGGGGGGGGLLHGMDVVTVGTTYNVTAVGAGGAGVSSGDGNAGSDSAFNSHTAKGGGFGAAGSTTGAAANDGGDGGNGGGGGGNSGGGSDGTWGEGYNRGGGGSNGATNYGGGGGGGANYRGTGGQSAAAPLTCDGGAGRTIRITGSDVVYAGGGGGCGVDTSGDGGTGGGGDGNKDGNGSNGTDGLGGGGGAAKVGFTSGDGGNGIVILRVLTVYYSGTTTGSPSVTTDGLYTVMTFSGAGSYTA